MFNLKSYRKAAVPLLAIQTADPAEIIKLAKKEINGVNYPILAWDCIHGIRSVNNAEAIANALNGNMEPAVATSNPVEMLRALEKLAEITNEKTMIIAYGLTDIMDDPQSKIPVRQAVWNLRDVLSTTGSILIMTAPMGWINPFPDDIAVVTNELPAREQHMTKAKLICLSAGVKEPNKKDSETIGDALLGLSDFAAEQALALSVEKKGINIDVLWERKRQQISETPGLSVYSGTEKFEDLGGLDQAKKLFKSLLNGRRKPGAVIFIDEIEKSLAGSSGDTSGVSQSMLGYLLSYMQDKEATGSILVGPPGCLAGDTLITYRRGKRNSGRLLTLKILYEKFNKLPVTNEKRGKVMPWHKDVPTYLHSYDETTGTIKYNKIKAVTYSGIKQCVIAKSTSGRTMTLTPDHLVLTCEGWSRADELFPGTRIICQGTMKAMKSKQERLKRINRVVVYNLSYYSSGQVKTIRDKISGRNWTYKVGIRSRLVVEANLNNMSYENYLTLLRYDKNSIGLKTLSNNQEVHHINENPLDDRLENLKVLTKREHTLEHKPLKQFNVDYIEYDTIESLFTGESVDTYDIEMKSPHNNFCLSNGFIVHNCAKSAMAKAIGNEGEIPTITLDLGGIKGSLVGESEGRMRKALSVVSAISGGRPLFVATCNAISVLPPELRRRFTVGTMFFDLPDKKERETIWNIYLKKYGLENQIHPADDGWTGAEIKQCCDMADRLNVSLIEAGRYVVPVSISAKEQIEKLRREASDRYLSASGDGIYVYAKSTVNVPSRKIDVKE